ncbi:MAG: hypothetical protein AAFU64_08745 [Bacteroidota bacterium]
MAYGAVLGIFLLLHTYATYCQLGRTYDSRDYQAAAKGWQKEYRMVDQWGGPYIERPPLFPLVLATLGSENEAIIRIFNALCAFGSLFIFLYLGEQVLLSKNLWLIYGGALAFSTPLLMSHSFYWSEPLFIFFLALLLLILWQFIQKRRSIDFILLILCSILLVLQRTQGVMIISAIAVILLEKKAFWTTLPRSILYFLAALFLWFAWVYHCLTIGGIYFHSSIGDLFQYIPHNLYWHTEAITAWLFPLPLSFPLRLILLLGLLILLISIWNTFKSEIDKDRRSFLWALIWIFIVYSLGMLIQQATNFSDSTRYQSPNYPLVFLFLLAMGDLWGQFVQSKWAKKMLLLTLVLWLLYPTIRAVKNAQHWQKVNCQEITKK